jgi:hypothetical protein
MRNILVPVLCLLLVSVFGSFAHAAKTTNRTVSHFKIYEAPRPPANPLEIQQMTGPM